MPSRVPSEVYTSSKESRARQAPGYIPAPGSIASLHIYFGPHIPPPPILFQTVAQAPVPASPRLRCTDLPADSTQASHTPYLGPNENPQIHPLSFGTPLPPRAPSQVRESHQSQDVPSADRDATSNTPSSLSPLEMVYTINGQPQTKTSTAPIYTSTNRSEKRVAEPSIEAQPYGGSSCTPSRPSVDQEHHRVPKPTDTQPYSEIPPARNIMQAKEQAPICHCHVTPTRQSTDDTISNATLLRAPGAQPSLIPSTQSHHTQSRNNLRAEVEPAQSSLVHARSSTPLPRRFAVQSSETAGTQDAVPPMTVPSSSVDDICIRVTSPPPPGSPDSEVEITATRQSRVFAQPASPVPHRRGHDVPAAPDSDFSSSRRPIRTSGRRVTFQEPLDEEAVISSRAAPVAQASVTINQGTSPWPSYFLPILPLDIPVYSATSLTPESCSPSARPQPTSFSTRRLQDLSKSADATILTGPDDAVDEFEGSLPLVYNNGYVYQLACWCVEWVDNMRDDIEHCRSLSDKAISSAVSSYSSLRGILSSLIELLERGDEVDICDETLGEREWLRRHESIICRILRALRVVEAITGGMPAIDQVDKHVNEVKSVIKQLRSLCGRITQSYNELPWY